MMTEFNRILNIISCSTNAITIDILQVLLGEVRKNKKILSLNSEILNQITERLWEHLKIGLSSYDTQLICSLSFFNIINYIQNLIYIEKVYDVINNQLQSNSKNIEKKDYVISLIYGLFQTTFFMEISIKKNENLKKLFYCAFNLLMLEANQYTQNTFLVFKILYTMTKTCSSSIQHIMTIDKQHKLLNMINHNWENPVVGVRDLNRGIFSNLLIILDNSLKLEILKEINNFYWNKAKYLMLSEIISKCENNIMKTVIDNKLDYGAVFCLDKPGLVSAGTDMYNAILKNVRNENEWCALFLNHVKQMVQLDSLKTTENFSNYWCQTTFRKFPSLLKIILEELDVSEFKEKIYSLLILLKHGHKLGLIFKLWNDKEYYDKYENLIIGSLNHCDDYIRKISFEIICLTKISDNVPHQLILQYLYDNVNSDCTVLRISMLNNFNIFLNNFNNHITKKLEEDEDISDLLIFHKDVQIFIQKSLNVNGNYQRKIATVKIIEIYFRSMTEKKLKNQSTKTTLSLYLQSVGYWYISDETFLTSLLNLLQDPAKDVRDYTSKVLFNNYKEQLIEPSILNGLISSAMKCIRSKYFYDIQCGQTIFKLITSTLFENKVEATFKSAEDIFYFAFNELTVEFNSKKNTLISIKEGKQLYASIGILIAVMESVIEKSYKIDISNDTMCTLLHILNFVSMQFSWEKETSSDFSLINEMVHKIIIESQIEYKGKYNSSHNTELSDVEQSVLNCLWLNVKASCEMAVLIIKYFNQNLKVITQCLNIITYVLEMCRHKGAIESAGLALGQAIQYLTSLPAEYAVTTLPLELLQSKLSNLILDGIKSTSVTRRGAGLSIMIHKIVSNDTRKGKPLFHYFMKTVLLKCDTENLNLKMNDDKDSPQAVLIHFLTKIVVDSNLSPDIMYYAPKLAKISFENLTNSHWQVRNAALQLYGALVPKLIGQKKLSSTGESISTMGCDELRVHFPSLWSYIKQALKEPQKPNTLQQHSDLIPIVNLLANTAKRYNFSFDLAEQKDSDNEILDCLSILLGSPIYTVRRLTAKCIFNMYTFENIYEILLKLPHRSENHLHGCLLLLRECFNDYSSDKTYEVNFLQLQNFYKQILLSSKHSYVCIDCYENVFSSKLVVDCKIVKTYKSGFEPGMHLWFENRIKRLIMEIESDFLPEIVRDVLPITDNFFDTLCIRLNTTTVPKKTLLELYEILYSSERIYQNPAIWKTLYEITKHAQLDVDISKLKPFLKYDFPYKLRYLLLFIARIIKANSNEEILLGMLDKVILTQCSPTSYDTDMKRISGKCINEFASIFYYLSSGVKVKILVCCVLLLQEENAVVRNVCTYFCKVIMKTSVLLSPFICMNRILDFDFLCGVFPERDSQSFWIEMFCDTLLSMVSSMEERSNSNDEYDFNPFTSKTNIYIECELIKMKLYKIRDLNANECRVTCD